MDRIRRSAWAAPLLAALFLAAPAAAQEKPSAAGTVTVPALLSEMVDFENLAQKPRPYFKQAAATSTSRESRKGGDAWYDNRDAGQYVRTEISEGRLERVLADLRGPGAITRFWSANPDLANAVRFYFDGEAKPRLEIALAALFGGKTEPFGPAFSYISGTGGNLYFPLPYASSLKITIEEKDKPVRLYYEIGYRSYEEGTTVESFDPRNIGSWSSKLAEVAGALARPVPAPSPDGARGTAVRLTVPPGKRKIFLAVNGEKAVYDWSAKVLDTAESANWEDPRRAHNAWRFLLLDISFDGEESIAAPLGDFFGSGPGLNPYENLFFTVEPGGKMTSRLLLPFRRTMRLGIANAGKIPYTVELDFRIGPHAFGERGYHLRAQWESSTRESWPFFDESFLAAEGEGKVVGTVYEIANPSLVWWGEGDQKIRVDREAYPSTFGTGTEDDYGFAYGDNHPFTRPYHAQTRVDGPWSGGHISLNRWYVLDALPFRTALRFDQEMWHWMPCRPTWSHVIYWYAKPGTPGPKRIDRRALAPRDLGIRENMLEPLEAEDLAFETTGGTAAKERLANCSGAAHLVWRNSRPGERLAVHFTVPEKGRYAVELNLGQSPDYGRVKLAVNGKPVGLVFDGWSPRLFWRQVGLGVLDLPEGDNVLTAVTGEPNLKARPGSVFGLDYIFLIRQ